MKAKFFFTVRERNSRKGNGEDNSWKPNEEKRHGWVSNVTGVSGRHKVSSEFNMWMSVVVELSSGCCRWGSKWKETVCSKPMSSVPWNSGSHTGSPAVSITWELVRIAHFGPYPKPTASETLGKKPSHWCLNKLSRRSQCRPTFETHRPREVYTWGEKDHRWKGGEDSQGRTLVSKVEETFFNRLACYA